MAYTPFALQCPAGSVPYTVVPGDTLYAIAQRFNTTVQNIISLNPGINPEIINVGQQICIPVPETEVAPCPIGTSPYEIKSGDTFATLAARFNTTVEAIMEANPGVDPFRLRIGQQICIAQNPMHQEPACPLLNTYVVQRGDILSTIARVFNTTVSDIVRLNPGLNPDVIYEGLVICLPITPPQRSIAVDIENKRLILYHYGKIEKTFPVATGKPTTPTPRGSFTIINKQVNPGGPYGTRWMGLSKPHYGIHGTNNPASIGTAASNGCVRMFNSDVEELFNVISVGTPVTIY